MEVLHTKNPDARPPTAASMDKYPDRPPEIVLVYITKNTVTEVAGRLSGGAGLGGTDSVSLQHYLLHFSATSGKLRLIVSDFAEWLGNRQPPWGAYRALTSGWMIALEK